MDDHKDEKKLGPLVPEMIAFFGGLISIFILAIPLTFLFGSLRFWFGPLIEEISFLTLSSK